MRPAGMSVGRNFRVRFSCAAKAINNNGQIAGWVHTGTGDNGFLYSNGTIANPGSFLAQAINNNGVMVGGSSIDSGGTVQDLNSPLIVPVNPLASRQ